MRNPTHWTLFTIGLTVAACGRVGEGSDPLTALDPQAQVARGEYIVSGSGCHDCHTPFKMGDNGPEPDMSRALSGHPQALVMPPPPRLPEGPWLAVVAATNTAWSGPWGVSFTANLTPDDETGLGKWTARNFIDTIRTGRHWGKGRPILPPMPVMVYANYSDEDLEAVFAYLQTLPAIRNRVPEPMSPEQIAAAQAYVAGRTETVAAVGR
jgi:mono/diheme cytochrome c family protein